jgi:hypothetical protein
LQRQRWYHRRIRQKEPSVLPTGSCGGTEGKKVLFYERGKKKPDPRVGTETRPDGLLALLSGYSVRTLYAGVLTECSDGVTGEEFFPTLGSGEHFTLVF